MSRTGHQEYRTSSVRTAIQPTMRSLIHRPYVYASVATRHAGTRHDAHAHVHARACAVLTWQATCFREGARSREGKRGYKGSRWASASRVCSRVETADAYMPGLHPFPANPCATSMRHMHTSPPPRAPHACMRLDHARVFMLALRHRSTPFGTLQHPAAPFGILRHPSASFGTLRHQCACSSEGRGCRRDLGRRRSESKQPAAKGCWLWSRHR